jgi:hypothetical protein
MKEFSELESKVAGVIPKHEEERFREENQRAKFYLIVGLFIFIMMAFFLWDLGVNKGLLAIGSNMATGYMVYNPDQQAPEAGPLCEKPYVKVCCLDENSNGVCDTEEKKVAQSGQP